MNQLQLKEVRKTCKLKYVIIVIETVMRIEDNLNKFMFNFPSQFCGRLTKNEQENSHCNFGCTHNRINNVMHTTSVNVALLQYYQC